MHPAAASDKVKRNLRRLSAQHVLLAIAAAGLALVVRIRLLPFESSDFICCGSVWYEQVATLGLRAFRHEFSNYNPPYLYLLYLVARTMPGLPTLTAVKLPSIVADFLCAVIVYRIVRLKGQSTSAALVAYIAVLFAPTVVLNSSFWGQADSIYAVGILASLYGALTGRPWLVTTAFGLALAFKLQAVFFLPFLLALWLRKELAWKHWAAVPGVLVAAILPAWAAGGSLASLLTIYLRQAQDYSALTMYAPTLYAWFPSPPELFRLFLPAGLIFALAAVAIYVLLIAHSRISLSRQLMVQLAALCVILVPYVTPKMHERYFFLADVLSLVFAAYAPSYFFVALIVNLCSFFSYPYVAQRVFPQAWLALAMLLALVVMVRYCMLRLYPDLARGLDVSPDKRPSVS